MPPGGVKESSASGRAKSSASGDGIADVTPGRRAPLSSASDSFRADHTSREVLEAGGSQPPAVPIAPGKTAYPTLQHSLALQSRRQPGFPLRYEGHGEIVS